MKCLLWEGQGYVRISWSKYNGFATVVIFLFLCQIQNAVGPFSVTSVHHPVFFGGSTSQKAFLNDSKTKNILSGSVLQRWVVCYYFLANWVDGFKISLWGSCHSFLGSKEGLGLLYSQCFEYFSNVCKFSCTPLIKMKALCQEITLDGSEI